MRTEFLIISIIYAIVLLWLVPKYTKCKYDHTRRNIKLVWKGFCIGPIFCVLFWGIVVAAINKVCSLELILLGIGLFLCALGDIALEIRFSQGGILFGIGHLFYISSMVHMSERKITPVTIVSYVLLVGIGTYLTFVKLGAKYRLFLLFYNLIISGSFAIGASLTVYGSCGQKVLGGGVVLLAVSDWLLARNKVFKCNFKWSMIAIVPYFLGQMMIALYPFLQ